MNTKWYLRFASYNQGPCMLVYIRTWIVNYVASRNNIQKGGIFYDTKSDSVSKLR